VQAAVGVEVAVPRAAVMMAAADTPAAQGE
jgi:hypothetical protein